MTKIKVEFESVEEMKEFCDTFGNSLDEVRGPALRQLIDEDNSVEGDCSDNIIQNRIEAEKEEEAAAKNPNEALDREAIKARLREMKVEFKDAARTPTLFKLLQEAEKEAGKIPTKPPKEKEPSSQVVTKKTVTEELQKLIAKDENQMARAREIIKKHAKVEVFADVKEEFYLAIFESCQEALKKEGP